MENRKSRKIGLTILLFFYNFLQIPKALLKKKKDSLNSDGPFLAQVVQQHRGQGSAPSCVRACAGGFAEKPSQVLNNPKKSKHY
jgi:hypothetical protein